MLLLLWHGPSQYLFMDGYAIEGCAVALALIAHIGKQRKRWVSSEASDRKTSLLLYPLS